MPISRSTVDIYNPDGTVILEKGALIDYGNASSGSLPTQVLSTGVGATLSTTRTVTAYIAVTNTAAGGTCAVALSPDNSTYSTVATATSTVNSSVHTITVVVPAGWFVKATFSNATIVTTFA